MTLHTPAAVALLVLSAAILPLAMRWYLWQVVPLVRAEDEAVTRSIAGRLALEIPLLLPSALVPGFGARWEPVDGDRAQVHIRIGAETFCSLLLVDEHGYLKNITMHRRGTACQGALSEGDSWRIDRIENFAEFNGYRIPTRARATRPPETDLAAPFLETEIHSATSPPWATKKRINN